MPEKYKVIISTTLTFVTITIVDWVDVFALRFSNVNINLCGNTTG
jgi:hypothetical protein